MSNEDDRGVIERETLSNYLNQFLQDDCNDRIAISRRRVKCCGSSRSLYCTECYKLLVPSSQWPLSIKGEINQLKLPFHLHCILDDRRKSSTGLHLAVLLQDFSSQNGCSTTDEDTVDGNKPKTVMSGKEQQQQQQQQQQGTKETFSSQIIITDLGGKSSASSGSKNENNIHESRDEDVLSWDKDTTFLLFPQEGESIPLSQVANKVSKLVVLDCKWTNSVAAITKKGNHSSLSQLKNLQKVHLSFPPKESFYWRWHNAGSGKVSTLEAVYFAAREIEISRQKKQVSIDNNNNNNNLDNHHQTNITNHNLLDIMWLFAIQRASTVQKAQILGKEVPFSEAGKESQRSLRRTIPGSEKHLRDIEQGRKLKQQHREQQKQSKQ